MFETSLLWKSTVAFTYLKVKTAECLCLLPVVLVLVLLFWFWSGEFGLVYITAESYTGLGMVRVLRIPRESRRDVKEMGN